MAVVVITGASSGIGAATAKALLARGHQLVVGARRRDRLQAVAAAALDPQNVLAVQADITRYDDLVALAAQAGQTFGCIDVWINNAGLSHAEAYPWWEESADWIEERVRTNLTAPLWSVKAAMPWLEKSKRPHLINIGSVSGSIAVKGVYSATKAGLRGHSEALRRELAAKGIGVSHVSPGFIATEMTDAQALKDPMDRPDIVAAVLVRLVETGPQRHVVVPNRWRLTMALNAVAPGLVDRVVARRWTRRYS